MKKSFLSILLIIALLHLDYRHAEAVTLPIGVGAGALVLVTAAGVAYYSRSGTSSAATPDYIRRAANSYWYTVAAASGGASVINTAQKSLLSTIPTSTVLNAVKANPTAFPLMNAATMAQDPATLPASNNTVGQKITFTVYNKAGRSESIQITSMGAIGGATPDLSYIGKVTRITADGYTTNVQYQFFYTAVNGIVQGRVVTGNIITAPPLLPATPQQFALNIAPTGSVTNTALEAELDRLRSDPSYVPTFTDESTGLPWAPPAGGVLNPTKLDVVQNLIDAQTAAQSAVDQAQANVNRATTALAANPSDPTLQRDLDQAKLQLAQAQAALSQAKAALAKEIPVTGTPDPDDMPDIGDTPELKSIDWSSGRRLLGQMETAWPFNLLLSLRGILQPLESSPVAPVFDLPIYGNTKLTISLAIFDPLAAILRWSFALLLTYSGILLVVRWYRGN